MCCQPSRILRAGGVIYALQMYRVSVHWPMKLLYRCSPAPITCGLSYIMADSRQIIWRESLRSLCKHSTRAQTVLPHNVACPFLPFLPWCGRQVSAAMICGRKRHLTLNLASMLRQIVLPDNMAPQIFPRGWTRKSVAKMFWRVSPYYASETAVARRENHDICGSMFLVDSPCSIALTSRNHARYHRV
jgi:hypothetical protein